MKQRTITSPEQARKAANDLLAIDPPFVVTVSRDRPRTDGQNRRYWATLDEYLAEVRRAVCLLANDTGHTPFEIRQILTPDMPPDHAAIMWCLSKEQAHEILKIICGIPTSTRLGTKQFAKFEERMVSTLVGISGDIQALIARKAA